MKYFIIALLFCICYVVEAQRPESIIKIHGRTYYLDSLDNGWYYYRDWKDTVPPKKTKPLNIKMKPRWMDSVIKEEIIILPLVERIIDSGYLSKSPFDTFLPKIDLIISLGMDTVKVIMLCSDTSSQNGYRTQRCYWMYGWEVRYYIDSVGFPNDYDVQEYLDENKKPLSKYLVVWISKQVK